MDDVRPGPANGIPDPGDDANAAMLKVGRKVYFVARAVSTGYELWIWRR